MSICPSNIKKSNPYILTEIGNPNFLFKIKIQIKIISKNYNEINEMIINKLDRGTTLIHGETGYKHNKYPVVLTVVNNRELTHLNNYVYHIDPDAFMIINKVNDY